MSYLKNNHPHLKEAQTAENPNRRSAQRCWAKVCRDFSMRVRPKSVGKKALMFQIPSAPSFFSLASSLETYRGIGHPKSLQRASIDQIGQFQDYFSHPLLACALLPEATSQYPSLCAHADLGRGSPLFVCWVHAGRCSMRPGAAELGWWQLPTAGTEPTHEPGSDMPVVGVERNSQSCSFPSAGFCPCAKVCHSHHHRAENMTMEINAVFGEQNVPMCLACDPLCHNLTLRLSLVNQGCKNTSLSFHHRAKMWPLQLIGREFMKCQH